MASITLALSKLNLQRSERLYQKKRKRLYILLIEVRKQRDMARKLGLLPFVHTTTYNYIYVMMGATNRRRIESYSGTEYLFYSRGKHFKEKVIKDAIRADYFKYAHQIKDSFEFRYQKHSFYIIFKKLLFEKGAIL